MKNNPVCLLIFLIMAISAWACKKEHNVLPNTSQVSGKLITDQASAMAAPNGVYYRFANVGFDYYGGTTSTLWTDVNADFPSELAGSMVSSEGVVSFDIVDVLPGDVASGLIWNYGYAL